MSEELTEQTRRKLLQNRIAEGAMTMPSAAVIALVVWLATWLAGHTGWAQAACFVAIAYLMTELNTSHALLRVRSRMVVSTFLVMACAMPLLFASWQGGVTGLAVAATITILFHTYQQPDRPGTAYYAFLMLGLGSLVFVHILWLLPVLWLLMSTQLQSLSLRTWAASLFAVATPYWLLLPYAIYQADFTPYADHFASLAQWHNPLLPVWTAPVAIFRVAFLLFLLLLAVCATVHLMNYSYEDKIRVRQLHNCFIWLFFFTLLMTLAQPRLYDQTVPMAVVFASPLVAHFFTFTHSKPSNIFFLATIVVALLFALAGIHVLTTPTA